MSFPVDEAIASKMHRHHRVDWDSVVSQAISVNLKMLAQTETPRILPAVQNAPVAAVARQERPVSPKPSRAPDPTPEEILQRAAELRAARAG